MKNSVFYFGFVILGDVGISRFIGIYGRNIWFIVFNLRGFMDIGLLSGMVERVVRNI